MVGRVFAEGALLGCCCCVLRNARVAIEGDLQGDGGAGRRGVLDTTAFGGHLDSEGAN